MAKYETKVLKNWIFPAKPINTFLPAYINKLKINFRKFNKEHANPNLMEDVEKWRLVDEEVRKNLPPGVKLVQTLRGHTRIIGRIAWSPDGRTLASPSEDNTFRLWNIETGECLYSRKELTEKNKNITFDKHANILATSSLDRLRLWEAQTGKYLRTLEGNYGWASSIAFDPNNNLLVSGGTDGKIIFWDVNSGLLLHTIETDSNIYSIVFDPMSRFLVSGDKLGKIKLWDINNGAIICDLEGHFDPIWSVAIDSKGHLIASASDDRTIKIWKLEDGTIKLFRTLEGHTASVRSVSFAFNGELVASKDNDCSVRLWDTQTGICVSVIHEPASGRHTPSLSFHPELPLLATVGSDPDTPKSECDRLIHIWKLDFSILLDQLKTPSISYTSAKVVLVGESGVGKTGLGWLLSHGEFKEHSSTHGQQFWLLDQLCKQRGDGTQCETLLWDLAGQPDYRLIHALFLDDADLALLLFDPTRVDDPLIGIEFWLKQLKVEAQPPSGIPTILVAARSDRGTPQFTKEELYVFCKQRGIKAYVLTSAKLGEGIEELVEQMQNLIPWNDKPATVTTETFKRIKDFVLDLKEDNRRLEVIMTSEELRQCLEKTDSTWKFNDAEMLTAVGHLENHGYVKQLKTSQGEKHILLAPELLNNLAASLVLDARKNQEGLGSLEEQRLFSGEYNFPELNKLTKAEQDILLNSAVGLFLKHNICFRETNPLNNRSYLVFPGLINIKKPTIGDNIPIEDDVTYTVSGAIENVYASLVVLMGYTQNFTRTNHWKNHARYEVGDGSICGFHLEEERAGELDFVLYYGKNTLAPVRMLFQSLFENFLSHRNLTIKRFEPVLCPDGHPLNREVVRQKMLSGIAFAFCNDCGKKIILPKVDQPINLTRQQVKEVEINRREADMRSRFEEVLFRLKSYVTNQKITSPECFISYAWGIKDHEKWVEKLSTDLQNAGIFVVLDRWENKRIGASVPRFIERVGKTERVIVIGTPLYQEKYINGNPMGGYVLAAEGDLIGKRMIGTEAKKDSVLPVLLEGTEESSFPLLLQGRVYADFRKSEAYFDEMLNLLLSLFQIPSQNQAARQWQELLTGQ